MTVVVVLDGGGGGVFVTKEFCRERERDHPEGRRLSKVFFCISFSRETPIP